MKSVVALTIFFIIASVLVQEHSGKYKLFIFLLFFFVLEGRKAFLFLILEFGVLGFFWSWNRCVYPKTWNCTACPPKCSTMNLWNSGCSGSHNCSCFCRYPLLETNRGYCVYKFSEVCTTEAKLGVILNSTTKAVNFTALNNRTNAFG